MPRRIQARVSEEEFKKIKKKAIDLGLTVEDFLKQSALIEVEKEESNERDSTNKR